MKFLLAVCLCLATSSVWSQAPPADAKKPIANPFDQPIGDGGLGGGMDMGMGMGMDMGMDMGMGGGMGMEVKPSPDQLFRANLPRAIQQLKKSKTAEERTALQKYIRQAFDQRYDRMMEDRKKDIARLRKSLTELESDLQRRTAAKDRVVGLQLQSVQLAAEGLLELNDLQGVGGRGGMDSMGMEMGSN
ncbi:hypothetical protein [Planctomycetes bacterium K23_9]|uniref:Periplasmic heavy metal sensor n=1 Tax=Stieleria marina TaxID=1930275 RepID=A0A517P375_9BACT|nr:hypothetical protein K239x_58370 [Planctomycetes bacterium K23_9]